MTTTDMARLVASKVQYLEADSVELKELTAFLMLPKSMFYVGDSGWAFSGYGVASASSTMHSLFAGIRRKHYHVIEHALKAL